MRQPTPDLPLTWAITWGKHENKTLAEIPASYFLWMYRTLQHLRPDLKAWIELNMETLKSEI